MLALALLGVVITPMGWRASEALFVDDGLRQDTDMMAIVHTNNSPYRGVFLNVPDSRVPLEMMGSRITGPREVFRQFVAPFEHMFSRRFSLRAFLYFAFGALWTLGVWAFVGVAICRISLLRLTRNEFIGMDDAFEFAVAKWPTVVGAILAPLGAIAVVCIPMFLIGLLMGFDLGLMVTGLLWGFVVAAACLVGVLLFGLMFGWPLMVASVGCESQNSFDAMTRAYAYTFQRPLHYFFYGILGILFGGLCWIIVAALADGIVELSFWMTSWGANVSHNRIDEIFINPTVNAEGMSAESQSRYIGRNAIGLWNGLIRSIAAAFLYGLFWCMASSVYLLLRLDVDETEMDEIFVSEEKRTYQLPPLQSDEKGIPSVQTPRPVLGDDEDHIPDGSRDETR